MSGMGADSNWHDDEDIRLPAALLSRHMPAIDDLAELKVTVFLLAALRQKEGRYRFLRWDEFRNDADLMRGLAACEATAEPAQILVKALQKAVERGTVLEARFDLGGVTRQIFISNDEAGQELRQQIEAGEWRPAAADEIEVLPPRPSLFAAYEENIGALTPMIADAIKEAMTEYPRDWIEDAMRYAVERNARNWRYIRKVLEAWQQEGRSSESGGRHLERHEQYTSGEWKDFIKS